MTQAYLKGRFDALYQLHMYGYADPCGGDPLHGDEYEQGKKSVYAECLEVVKLENLRDLASICCAPKVARLEESGNAILYYEDCSGCGNVFLTGVITYRRTNVST